MKNTVTVASIEAKIAQEEYFNPDSIPHLTICVLRLNNGFGIVGTSAPADPVNFNADLGAKLARADAIRQIWPLEGYRLRDDLAFAAES